MRSDCRITGELDIRKILQRDLNPEQSQNWVEEYEEIIRGINGYIRYIRKKRLPKK
jgi:hypothetical protein